MLMIIAPSKSQELISNLHFTSTLPPLLDESQLLMTALKKLSLAKIAKLMKTSPRLTEQTKSKIKTFSQPFNKQNAAPAITVFQGDVYSKIAINDYNDEDNSYLQDHLRIISGLYGVLRPFDLIQSYRLEMAAQLQNCRGKNLYEFWGDRISAELNRNLATQKKPILVNLASNEYSKAVRKKSLKGSILQIDFKEGSDSGYRTVAIHAKRARGMMVDFAVKNKVRTVEALQYFKEASYCFRPDLSTEDRYSFTREAKCIRI